MCNLPIQQSIPVGIEDWALSGGADVGSTNWGGARRHFTCECACGRAWRAGAEDGRKKARENGGFSAGSWRTPVKPGIHEAWHA